MKGEQRMRMIIALAAAAALAACGVRKEAEREAEPAEAPAASQPSNSGPAVDEAEASADTAWIELMGAWAPKDACEDATRQWIIAAHAFHLSEMHCAVSAIELAGNGVKATADCGVEGDDDGVDDVFTFVRQKNATLTITQLANGAETAGLVPCSEDMIP